MAAAAVFARRRTQQRQRLAPLDHLGEEVDFLSLLLHLLDVAPLVLRPGDRLDVLAVVVGVQLTAGAEVGAPQGPVLVLLRKRPRPIAADEESEAVGLLDGVAPALGLD